jgi:hypothetical protein
MYVSLNMAWNHCSGMPNRQLMFEKNELTRLDAVPAVGNSVRRLFMCDEYEGDIMEDWVGELANTVSEAENAWTTGDSDWLTCC